jgi:putative transposase
VAHHVGRPGNRRQPAFFGDEDDRAWRALLAEVRAVAGATVWGYRLMPNHVHPVMAPARARWERRYTRRVNSREGWRGHPWQGRFASVAMDEARL